MTITEKEGKIFDFALFSFLALFCIIIVIGVCQVNKPTYRFSEADKDLMTRVLWVEAGANSRELQVACGSVMLNQLDCGNYGKTIRDVLTREGAYEGYKKIDRADGQDLAACREVVEELCKNGSQLPSYVWYFCVGGQNWEHIETYKVIEGVYFQYFPEEWRNKGWH